jgi:plastocyanin
MRRNRDDNRTVRRMGIGAVIAAFAVVLAACGSDMSSSDNGGSTSSAPTGGSGSEVQIKLIAFQPAQLEVAAGTTVTWRQRDPGSHTVTSGTVKQGAGAVTATPDGTFDSGELVTDDSFELAFADRGTYSYFCQIHPATMRGEITVR